MSKVSQTTVVISVKTMLWFIAIITGLYLFYRLQDVILALFISLLIATAVNPFVVKLEQRGLNRSLAISLIFGVIIISLIFLFAALLPPFVRELSILVNHLAVPDGLRTSFLNLEYNLQDLEVIINQLKGLPKLVEAVSSAFSVIVITLTFSVVTFYLLMERPHLHRHLILLFGRSHDEAAIEAFVNNLEHQIGGWVRGELTLMLIIGSLTYLALTILGLPYALPLAILAGFLEIIPNIGPTLAAVPALILAFTQGSFLYLILVGGAYIVIQQLENTVIVPRVMKKAAGIHPLITILIMIIGLRLFGFIGALIAVPFFITVKVIVKEMRLLRLPKTF